LNVRAVEAFPLAICSATRQRLEVGPEAAVPLRDAQPEQTGGVEVGVVVERE
jgi:hypothetical protein